MKLGRLSLGLAAILALFPSLGGQAASAPSHDVLEREAALLDRLSAHRAQSADEFNLPSAAEKISKNPHVAQWYNWNNWRNNWFNNWRNY
ncbi:MAG: hypothetical protein AAFY02_02615 [Pseudomonadota bacterium]